MARLPDADSENSPTLADSFDMDVTLDGELTIDELDLTTEDGELTVDATAIISHLADDGQERAGDGLLPGHSKQRYRVGKMLGRGGMGVVRQAKEGTFVGLSL